MITVLLADDHNVFLMSLRSLLEEADDLQIVATASNGEEAVAQAQIYLPDVALIDIAMPGMDGFEVTRQILAYYPYTRVIILTISNSSHYIQRALEAGATGFLPKDRVGNRLVAAIRGVTQRGRPARENVEEFNAWDDYGDQDFFFRR